MHIRRSKEWPSLFASVLIRSGGFIASYVCLPAMLVLMAIDPILRYLVGRPFFWSNEVTTLLMVLMFFTGLGFALAKGTHVRVTVVFQILPPKVQNALWVMIAFAGLFYATMLGYAVVRLALDSFLLGVKTETSEIPIFPWQMAATLGLITLLLALVMFAIERIAIALKIREEKKEEDRLVDLNL